MARIAIIGSAGRGEATQFLTPTVFANALAYAKDFVSRYTDVTLVSGGAAFMDHLAVQLFLLGEAPRLELHLPCPWNTPQWKFKDTGARDWRSNPGGTSNHYHNKFSVLCRIQSLGELNKVIPRADVHIGAGFRDRNTGIGRVDVLLAFTAGRGEEPADGGTHHTWSASPAPIKVHVPLWGLR